MKNIKICVYFDSHDNPASIEVFGPWAYPLKGSLPDMLAEAASLIRSGTLKIRSHQE